MGGAGYVERIADPPARANSIKVEDNGNAAQDILDYLVEKHLV